MEPGLSLIIISDRVSAGLKQDKTRERVSSWCAENRFKLISVEIVSDDKAVIGKSLQSAIKKKECNLIITSGGTGFSVRDVTPEATRPLLEKITPGIDEYLRREGAKETPFSILSRGISGIVENKIVINLPGNPNAVINGLNMLREILLHALRTIDGDVGDSEHIYGEPHS